MKPRQISLLGAALVGAAAIGASSVAAVGATLVATNVRGSTTDCAVSVTVRGLAPGMGYVLRAQARDGFLDWHGTDPYNLYALADARGTLAHTWTVPRTEWRRNATVAAAILINFSIAYEWRADSFDPAFTDTLTYRSRCG